MVGHRGISGGRSVGNTLLAGSLAIFMGKEFELRSLHLSEGKEAGFVHSAQVLLGKKYNLAFRWGNDAVYCSELIYEAFAASTGMPMCHLDTLSSLNYKPWFKKILQFSRIVLR